MARKLAAGNWKMNGLAADLQQLSAISETAKTVEIETLICPPAPLISRAAAYDLAIGGQSCHPNKTGAHTGDISAEMLADAGATYVLTGHSERRTDHGETSADVAAQTRAAWDAGLCAIVCIGETLEQRENGETLDIIRQQIAESVPVGATSDTTIIAYEPVWAIGTGRVPSLDQIAEVHADMRAQLAARFDTGAAFTLLYGGSVKASNAAEIFAVEHVHGALVGGASLTAEAFCPIIEALAQA